VNGLSSPAKTDNHTVLIYIYHIFIVKVGKADIPTIIRYKFNIIIVKIGKAAKGLRMQDIAFEQVVKLGQVWYS
jgi:hypothetical protein